jgi:colanic acid biosynthesis glycosyl transferase WcaI
MRILLVGINYAPDFIGVAKYNTELCEALVVAGHDVRVVSGPPYYPKWNIPALYRNYSYRSETINRVFVTRSPIYVPKKPTGAKRLLHHASFALSSIWPLLKAAFRWQPNVVLAVAPSLMSSALTAWIARRAGAVSWLHVQDFEIDAAFDLGMLNNRGLRGLMHVIERHILRSFDRVSTISPQMLRRLESKGVDPPKIIEMRNWTDTRRIAPGHRDTRFRSDVGLNGSHFVGLYSGTMSTKQGLDLIVDAARSLVQSDPQVQFILCGDGPQKAMLQEISAGLANIHFLGLQADDQFAELLSTADFHLIPQRAEAADLVLPSKLGGIFATGQPVIVMADPGTGLAQEVSGAGLIIPPGNTLALAAAIRTLCKDVGLRRELGEGGRRRAIERWDKTAILATLEKNLLALDAAQRKQKERSV